VIIDDIVGHLTGEPIPAAGAARNVQKGTLPWIKAMRLNSGEMQ
jgi:hypothetical protein